uniref:Transposase n=1 Tax=Haemonchus contortus TaxID=6289 RepID=A0A7I4Z5H1_HAECO
MQLSVLVPRSPHELSHKLNICVILINNLASVASPSEIAHFRAGEGVPKLCRRQDMRSYIVVKQVYIAERSGLP